MEPKSEPREVCDFQEVVLRGIGDINLQQGESESLVVEAHPEDLSRIKTEVHGGKLELGFKGLLDSIVPPRGPITFHITMKTVRGVSISGQGRLRAPRIATDRCSLSVSGHGEMDVDDLQADSVAVSVSGSGTVRLEGNAARQEVRISGAGALEAIELRSREAAIHISGSGDAEVSVEGSLDVQISGHGHVRYRGQPRVTQTISGAGIVQPDVPLDDVARHT